MSAQLPIYRWTRGAARRLLSPFLGSLTHVVTTEPVVALTFDDGPHPASTGPLLEILRKHGAHATFFMIGEAAARYPDLVRRIHDEGHAIGNHTESHCALTRLTRRERLREIRAGDHARGADGTPWFRPPYGELNLSARLDLLRCRCQVVTWDFDSEDWWNPDPAAIAQRLVHGVRPGSIVLLHDMIHQEPPAHKAAAVSRPVHHDRAAMLEAVDAALLQLGPPFRFVTVPALLRHGRPYRALWSSWQDSPASRRAREPQYPLRRAAAVARA